MKTRPICMYGRRSIIIVPAKLQLTALITGKDGQTSGWHWYATGA
jgi:hypothetical protein